MMTLWIVIAAMLLMAAVILLWPIACYKQGQENAPVLSQKQQNVSIFQERLAELENEQTQGNLDKSTFQQLKTELEKTLLGDVQFEEQPIQKAPKNVSIQNWLVMGVITGVFVLACLATYNSLGASDKYQQFLTLADAPLSEEHVAETKAPDFAMAVKALKVKLAENPEDIEKWFLLANSYAAMGDFRQAGEVYNKVAGILGEDKPGYAAAKAAYAQMMFQVAGEKMVPVVQQAINEALRVDPEEPTALILQGLNAYQEQAYPEAIAAWEKAKIKAGEAQVRKCLDPAIAEARREMGAITPPVMQQEKSDQKIAETITKTASIKVNLDISPALRAKVSPQERIFVFAKAGMPMPLAAERLQVKDLPITLVLDDTKAAMPTAKISSAEFVDITARVALSGSPRASKGDLYATAKHVAVQKGVEITLLIDKVVD
ncbi:c-type cytochrome biogenesis protein CcmI [Methylococcaceae bacterium HT4]|nr:c-type cytochrome biogenesis protein CcmI [Methylococcaceae bacterium HT4]TXL21405.1 c-type cytochrome biogenesis protein CcmI [Methylococcaceae bacterium HT5]